MRTLCATGIVLLVLAPGALGQERAMVEWPYVGGAQAHTKYSPLADINRSNVGELEIVWQWDPNEMPMPELGARPGRFQATPLMIDGTLYFPTMYSRVVALDAESGAEKWSYDPRVYEDDAGGASPGGSFHHRGIAFRREGTPCTCSSTAAPGCTPSTPPAVSSSRASATAAASCSPRAMDAKSRATRSTRPRPRWSTTTW